MELEKYLNNFNLKTIKITSEILKCKKGTGKLIKLRNL
jgi:hypothetical protein